MDRDRLVTGYAGRHRKHADPRDLPASLRPLANLIVIVPSKSDDSE
jgi:hypothetical protein